MARADKKQAMTRDEIEGYVGSLISVAQEFIESFYLEEREKNWQYYQGLSSVPKQAGRHQITMAKSRDLIRMVEPAVLRPFATEPNAVEFKGRTLQGAKLAEQMTLGVRYFFYTRNNGYRLLADAVREGLVNDSCVMKSWWDSTPVVRTRTLSNLSPADVSQLTALKNVEIISTDTMVEDGEPSIEVVLEETEANGTLVIEGIKLENFLIDSGATCAGDARIVGHFEEMTVAEAEARGYPRDLLLDSIGEDTRSQQVDEARRDKNIGYTDYVAGVEDNLPVVVYEVYVNLDPTGIGSTQLHKIIMAGDAAWTMIMDPEPVDEHPYALGSLYPLPHSPFGEGLVESLRDDQDAFTSMMREMLDNLQQANRPGKEVVEGMVNLGDLMNTELGALVRTRAPNMIKDLTVPFVAGQTLPILQFIDQQTERKTGISSAAMGFSPDMLQSTTKSAVDAANRAAEGQVEYMGRNLAETLLKPLFRRCAKLLAENADRAFMVMLADEPVMIDPRGWTLDIDIEVNVGLGSGRYDEKVGALQQILMLQKEIIATRGSDNGVVTLKQFANTIGDLLGMVGLNNPTRYIGPITPQVMQAVAQKEQQAQQAAQQQGQGGGVPAEAIIGAEKIKQQTEVLKIKTKGEEARQKAIMDARLKVMENAQTDDRLRDQMLQDLVLQASEIMAKYGTQVNVERIKAEQAATGPKPNGGAG